MKKTLTMLTLIMPVFAAASPQDDAAESIERMSDTYVSTAQGAARNPIGGSIIRLDDCKMTIISTTQHPNSDMIVGFSTHIDLPRITFGSRTSPDISYMIKDEGAAFDDHGVIPFYSDTPYPVRTHGPLPEFLGPDATLAAAVVLETEMEQGGYVMAQTTPTGIDQLAQALVDYQRDYCLPAS